MVLKYCSQFFYFQLCVLAGYLQPYRWESHSKFFLFIKDVCIYVCDLSIDAHEPSCGCWDLNSGPSEDQSVLLTAEPSHQPKNESKFKKDSQHSRQFRKYLVQGHPYLGPY